MGALPKRRISTGRKGRRRKTIKLKLPTLINCPDCGQPKIFHQLCPNCVSSKSSSGEKEKAERQKEKNSPKKQNAK